MRHRNQNPPHCVLKRRQWWAKLAVPFAVQPAFDGKKWFLTPLHETNRDRAQIKSIPIIAEWRQRIAAARANWIDPIQFTIARLTKEYTDKCQPPLDQAGVVQVREVVSFVFQEIGGVAAVEQHSLLCTMRGDVVAALAATPHGERATEALRQITAGETVTPYLRHIDRWIASCRPSKTTEQYEANIREFAAAVTLPIERLTGPAVQGWIEATLKVRSAPTVRYKLAGNRHYWTWMAANGLASSEHNPFHGRLVKGQETAVERATNARTRFAPIDVPPLWIEAERYGDFDLYAAILLTAHQGWRLEEVCRLRCEDIRVDRETGVRCIRGGLKTEAGVRDMPIPLFCGELVTRLAQRKDSDGYLIRSTGLEKWGNRGGGLSQRFTRLKRRLGHNHTKTFHSLRHDYAHMLSKARVPMHNIKDLMGHKGKSVTEGYIGETGLDEMAYFLNLIRYPLDGGAERWPA